MNKRSVIKFVIMAIFFGWCLIFGCYHTLVGIYNLISPVAATPLIKSIFVVIAALIWDLLFAKVDFTK